MARDQIFFEKMFSGQSFGPREGFSPLAWQSEIKDVYKESVLNFRQSGEGNGHMDQHVFPFFAATATGKTKASGYMASFLFNHGLINQVFFCCPNQNILDKTITDYRRCFGIDMVPLRFREHRRGIPRSLHGAALTYNYLFNIWDNEKHRQSLVPMFGGPSLIIFDEVHHLLEDESWGRAALAAFGSAPFVISMTGTPFNSKRGRFAYCNYEETSDTSKSGLFRLKAEFNYSLGKAVAHGIVRKPHFVFSGRKEDEAEVTKVEIRIPPEFDSREVTFDEKLDDTLSKLRLRGAVAYGAITRKTFLKNCLARCEEEGRRTAIFLGGDSNCETTATQDAEDFLPAELHDLGYTDDDIEIIVGKGKEARRRVNTFGKSSKKILICINMISEGVDIPELSAAIFLTVVTAKQTTIQRIGRVLRLMDPHRSALIFMFADPTNVSIAMEIEDEIKAEEIRLKKKSPSERIPSDEEKFRRAEAVGISGGNLSTAIFNGDEQLMKLYDATILRLKEKNLPSTMLHAALELLGVTDVSR